MKTRTKREWFEDDAFWIELYPFLFSEQRFSGAADQADKLVKLVDPQGNKVLDLCCGPGRFSIPLATKGFVVTGVDRTAFLLDKARARAKTARVKIEWIQKDIRNFIRPNTFDVVVSMYTSFGYFDDRQDDLDVLRNTFTNLKPGGTFLIDVFGKERVARVFQPTVTESFEDGTLLVKRHEIFDDWTRLRNEWIVIRNGHAKTFSFYHTIYSGQELRDRLQLVGFRDIRLYGNLDGDDYSVTAERLIATASKPEASTTRRRATASSRRPTGRG
jgi:SAM-dependent methyltransferase